MPLTIHQLENELFNLDLNTRAHFAEKLILSIDAPSESENLGLWVDEAERRLADLRAGKAMDTPRFYRPTNSNKCNHLKY